MNIHVPKALQAWSFTLRGAFITHNKSSLKPNSNSRQFTVKVVVEPSSSTILYPVVGHYPCKDCTHCKLHLFSHKSPASQSIASQLFTIAFFNQKTEFQKNHKQSHGRLQTMCALSTWLLTTILTTYILPLGSISKLCLGSWGLQSTGSTGTALAHPGVTSSATFWSGAARKVMTCLEHHRLSRSGWRSWISQSSSTRCVSRSAQESSFAQPAIAANSLTYF